MDIRRSLRWTLASTLMLCNLAPLAIADPPAEPNPPDARTAPPKPEGPEIKPLPLTPIPDDPPPHEGAMIELPHIVEPPDLITVEVLEALPGRPISGERLVRPDGKISLGFYGEIHVSGLTVEQIKVKIIEHLRAYLYDEVLGLEVPEFSNPPEDKIPLPEGPPPAPGADEVPVKRSSQHKPMRDSGPGRRIRPSSANPRARVSSRRFRATAPVRLIAGQQTPPEDSPARVQVPATGDVTITIQIQRAPAQPDGQELKPGPFHPDSPRMIKIAPKDSTSVFVDVSAYNSKSYFVQGDVAAPGKLPWTGRDTVLDALNYAGGFVTTADPKNIRLVRPARGGKPSRIYTVDLEAIRDKGDAKANYQIFPGDRLVIGRHPLMKTTIEIDRLAGALQTVVNSTIQYIMMYRTLAQATSSQTPGAPALTPEQREQIMKDWVDFWWKAVSKPEGVELDEKTFREGLMRQLNPPQAPADAKDKK
jgi:protein involved in polysaccharide export with SLBB domain